MGMFDYVHVHGPEFVCSEGHDLTDEEFQTKDFACVLGIVDIADGRVTYHGGSLGLPSDVPVTDYAHVYATCKRCPALVQDKTWNLAPTCVEFKVHIVEDVVQSIKLESRPTKEQLATEMQQSWMQGCHGPFSYEDAEKFRRQKWAEARR